MTNTNTDRQLVNTATRNRYSGIIEGVPEAFTIDDIRDSGMFDYKVSKRPLFDVHGAQVPGAFQVIREDTEQHLANVGPQYTPLQPDVLLDVATEISGLAEDAGGLPCQRWNIAG